MSDHVAREILRQLGGNRFVAMTGANSFSYSDNALSFRFKGSKKWKACRIELTPMDLYTVIFFQMKKFDVIESRHENIYVDQLVELFERETGLYTSL